MRLGEAIKLLRARRDLSQHELAERAGVSFSYISLLERNKRDPQFSTVVSIARALHVPVTVLTFLGTDDDDLFQLDIELREKLSGVALEINRGVS